MTKPHVWKVFTADVEPDPAKMPMGSFNVSARRKAHKKSHRNNTQSGIFLNSWAHLQLN